MSFLFLLDKTHIFFIIKMWQKRRENICNWFIMQLTKKKKKKWLKGISGDIYFWMILHLYDI